ncbi:NAD(P)H-quinone oxidoreductase [Pseudoalteromonas sp. SSDWG2]|uniref:NAD(P)H-quinone oxidoreductase n=1 Tax=Pseudoalteromonas sp. SSDWG2 TaxID=3139391 RepID=UPI003BA841ED
MLTIDLNENKQLVIIEKYDLTPKDQQVLIKVHASAVNRADLLQRKGLYPPPVGDSDILGLEAAGEIVAVGDGVSSKLLGKRVMALCAGGGYGEYVCVHYEHCIDLPPSYSYEMGAGFCEVFFTAFDALRQSPEFGRPHTLLVHAGASGVGTAAIILAKRLGARVVATVGNQAKREACEALGADVVINYKEHNWCDYLKAQDIKIDLVIDPIAGEYIRQDIEVMAMDGTIVILAMLGGRYCEKLDMAKVLAKRVRVIGSTLRNRSISYKSKLVQDLTSQFGPEIQQGLIKPVIDSIYSWRDVEQAHQRLENNENIGKVILQHD